MTSSAPTAIVRDGLPDWLLPVRAAAETVRPEQLSRFLPPAEGGGAPPSCCSSARGRAARTCC